MKAFEQSLEQLKVSAAPKPKFAFKRKQAAPVVAILASPSTPVEQKAVASEPLHPSSTSTDSSTLSSARALTGHRAAYLTASSLPTSSLSGSEVTISDIDHCIIDLLPDGRDGLLPSGRDSESITAIHVKNVKNSLLLLPIMSGSAILYDVQNSILVIGCHQVSFFFCLHLRSTLNISRPVPNALLSQSRCLPLHPIQPGHRALYQD